VVASKPRTVVVLSTQVMEPIELPRLRPKRHLGLDVGLCFALSGLAGFKQASTSAVFRARPNQAELLSNLSGAATTGSCAPAAWSGQQPSPSAPASDPPQARERWRPMVGAIVIPGKVRGAGLEPIDPFGTFME